MTNNNQKHQKALQCAVVLQKACSGIPGTLCDHLLKQLSEVKIGGRLNGLTLERSLHEQIYVKIYPHKAQPEQRHHRIYTALRLAPRESVTPSGKEFMRSLRPDLVQWQRGWAMNR